MANKIVTVLEADGITQTDLVSLDVGRQAAAASKSIAFSSEDFAVLDGIETTLTAIDGRVDGLEALITSTNTKLDTLNTSITSGTVNTGTPGTPDILEVLSVQGEAGMYPVASVGKSQLFEVTLSCGTSAQAVGTLIADSQVLTDFFRIADGTAVLNSIQVVDQDDQKQAIDFYLLDANVSLGTENSAVSISDANAVNITGPFSVAAADYKDLGGVSVAKVSGIGQVLKSVSTLRTLYIAAVCASATPTYTASGIKVRLGVLLD